MFLPTDPILEEDQLHNDSIITPFQCVKANCLNMQKAQKRILSFMKIGLTRVFDANCFNFKSGLTSKSF